MRIGLLAAAICFSVVGLAVADDAKAAIRKDTSIPAGGLGPALQTLAKQYDFQVLYRTEVVGSLHTEGVVGQFTSEEALKQLLKGTGLTYRYLDEKTITIISAGAGSSAPGSAPSPNPSPPSTSIQPEERRASAFDSSLLAQAGSGQAANAGSIEPKQKHAEGQEVPLQEVIVTAQKRSERLLDVPVPVTVVPANELVETNELRLQDYYTQIPGLSVVAGSSSSSFQTISIRGITTGAGTNPTVGITIDDVPYGSSTAGGGGNIVPDIDPSDLARIEVLRGPQGTLYGASSMGGLIKYVTVDPSTSGYSGRVEAGVDSVYNGAELGYSARGAVNMPLGDVVAIRISGFTRLDPGYIDNPVLNENGVNEQRVSGGRIAMLWTLSPDFSLKLSALYQQSRADGLNDVDVSTAPGYSGPALGDLQQNYVRGIGENDGKVQAYSATLTGKLGNVSLTALTGYNIRQSSYPVDYSFAFGGLAQSVYGFGGAELVSNNDIKKFTQEIRLSAPIGSSFDWLLGAFYTHEDSAPTQAIVVIDPASGAAVADGYQSSNPNTYAEYAGFADLTWHVTDRFDIQVGGRESSIRQANEPSTLLEPIFGLPNPSITQATHAEASPFTYLLTPSFKLSPELLLYARLASGYRPGGPNSAFCTGFFPCQFDPDKTKNYEVGAKGDFLAHRFSFDASLYYIDWKNMQLFAVDPVSHFGYDANASAAKSQGVELSVEARPVANLTIAAWVVWSDAELTEPFPAPVLTGGTYGVSGDRLPYSSRFSGDLSVNWTFPVGRSEGFVAGSISYVGDRQGAFSGSASTPRQDFPSFARADLRCGLRFDTWTTNIFLDNAFDRRGLLVGGSPDAFPPFAYTYIQPRTVGISLSKVF